MCLIAFAWGISPDWPLILLANRDEFHARPSAPLAFWEGAPGLVAGKDLKEGGTWLGLRGADRLAALTNVRDPAKPPGRRSRGLLVSDFLRSSNSAADYLRALAGQADMFGGFNLLLRDGDEMWFYSNHENGPRQLEPGVYGLSNASLDSHWPKLKQLRSSLAKGLDAEPEAWFEWLQDRQPAPDVELPDTGVGLEMERVLSPAFVCTPVYGTRCSSVVLQGREGRWRFIEQSYDPEGLRTERVELTEDDCR